MRSAVAGSERLKRRVYEATGLQEVFNDNNKHISLKSSPDKTVPALSPLAEKEGIVVKLNDTGSWRGRHALLVPHTFLYYFGENTAATDLRPHGVIDLELYTDIKVVDGNVVRLAPEDDNSPIRTFYLRLPSKEEAEGWADTIRGTRFVSVREERDALRSAKTVLTEQIAILVETLKESRDSLEASHRRETAAVSELAHSNAKEARCAALVRALAAYACDAGEERRWSEARAEARAGQRWGSDRHLVEHIESKPGGVTLGPAVCALSELAALEEAVSERVREVAALKRANETLRENASAEAEHRREQEAAALNLRCQEHERVAGEAAAREEVEAEVQALRVELEATRAGREEARTNLGVVAAACREAEAKARELQEHRRVLAREVKASRAEQRRLSAALACATRAATAAAATAAAATAAMATASASASNATAADANAADANATAGNAPNVDGGDPSRSPSSAGSLAGDGARKVEVGRGSRRIGGGGGEIEGVGGGGSEAETDVGDEAGGERYHGEGDDACVGSSPARDNGGTEAGQKNKTERAVVLGPTPTRDSVEPGDAESSSSSVDGTRGPVPAGVDDKGDILSSPSPQLRPPPLDLLRTPLRGSEGGVGGESGATSPEAGSPGLPEGGSGGSGSVSGGSCGSGGGGGSCGISGSSGRRRESEWNPLPSPSSDTQAISPLGRGSCGSVGAKTLGWSKVGVGGGGGDNGKEGQGREMTGRAEEVVAEDGALIVDRRSLCIATGVGASVGAGARRELEDADRALPAGSPSETDLVGESSRLVNEMVQIFSDGLRESTRTRRMPLLGSLDAGSDAGDATKEVEEEEGGDVTDGVDRDSRPFATPKEEEREEKEKEEGEYGAWSAWSTVVVSCDGPVAVAVKEESGARAREGPVCAESLSGSGGVGGEEEGSRSGSSPDGQQQSPSKDTGDGTGSVAPTGSTDDHNPPAAAILMGPRTTATITESELGAGDPPATASPVAALAPAASTAIDRRGSLQAAANETAAAGVTEPLGSPADWLRKVGRPDQGWPPLHEESGCSPTPYPLPENGNSCRGSGDGNAAAAAAVAAATAAAAAAAAAAAERGGRVSSEAAAAARRWEAKLKGSLMSMTEGVRWGMGPQRLNGVPNADEH